MKSITVEIEGVKVTWSRHAGYMIDPEEERRVIERLSAEYPGVSGERLIRMTCPAVPDGVLTSAAFRRELDKWSDDLIKKATAATKTQRAAMNNKRRRSAGTLPVVSL